MLPNRPPLARLEGVAKRFGALTALSQLDLSLHAGEVLALLGRNGAGKTTTLGLLTGRLSPDAGTVRIGGADPRDFQVRRQLGVMLQQAALPDTLSVHELLRLFAGYYPAPRPLDETLSMAGIEELAARRYQTLSGGQQRRVQFAIAIAGCAPILLIDEPTTGLDIDARRALWQCVRRLKSEGSAILLTTHDLEEADALADRIVLLDGGRIRREGTPAEIKSAAAGSRVILRTALDSTALAALADGAVSSLDDGRYTLTTRTPEALLRVLLPRISDLRELEVRPLSLEEAFLLHTEAPREAA